MIRKKKKHVPKGAQKDDEKKGNNSHGTHGSPKPKSEGPLAPLDEQMALNQQTDPELDELSPAPPEHKEYDCVAQNIVSSKMDVDGEGARDVYQSEEEFDHFDRFVQEWFGEWDWIKGLTLIHACHVQITQANLVNHPDYVLETEDLAKYLKKVVRQEDIAGLKSMTKAIVSLNELEGDEGKKLKPGRDLLKGAVEKGLSAAKVLEEVEKVENKLKGKKKANGKAGKKNKKDA